jgi:uncharacterized sporulation protein YeaH/YhbH (DUF444 family)
MPLAKVFETYGCPSYSVWRRWCQNDDELMAAYRAAKRAGLEALAAEAMALADSATPANIEVVQLRVRERLHILNLRKRHVP